ncbi:uncharacterized protein A1O9_01425 [Exophiala aquamarina CBS 119918]|uniref:Caib baif family enzyme n=1 Tax=Exophiala aquamarina CBS 119918 TaxID=1182545 RepID=A0A072PUM1_9EURO|nr:uncharacterized protein A1O9_01425 [Exophiala aquamarina CBS 119918]KEF63447.1 hypothetical protein A1O9_01425 [Exophiala aquamarina CBS 119918]
MAALDHDRDFKMTALVHIVTPIGMLGYGINQDHLNQGLKETVPSGVPTAIILDSGSTDGGPNCLALGVMTCARSNYKRDLTKILASAHQFKVPVLIGSAGGDGSDEHVEEILQIVEEIAAEPGNDFDFKSVTIFASVPKELVSRRLAEGAVFGCGRAVPPASQKDIDDAPRILAQMGPEPFVNAMQENPDFSLVIGGRAYDPAPYVAFADYWFQKHIPDPDSEQYSRLLGAFTHMGKIMECGGVCAVPKSAGAVSTVYLDGTFDVRPLDPRCKCTSLSVAAHTLYEKTRPDILHGPGGYLDLQASKYEELSDGRTVRVRGGIFRTSKALGVPYTVKLEAARRSGFRSLYMGSVRDPTLIRQLDEFLLRIKAYVAQNQVDPGMWKLGFHTYGRSGRVKGQKVDLLPDEVFIVGEALADTQALATSVCDTARVATIHGAYPGQKATSGNFAFGIVGAKVIEMGSCPEFCLYHLMELQPGEESAALIQVKREPDVIAVNTPELSTNVPVFRWRTERVGKAVGLADSSTQQQDISPEKGSDEVRVPAVVKAESEITRGLRHLRAHATLADVASVLRSKNSGPFEITFDVIFESEQVYRIIKESQILSSKLIEDLYDLKPEDVLWCGWFDQARAWKATIPRKRHGISMAGGGFMENDIHGSQQYIPLLHVELPEEVLGPLQQAGEGAKHVNL